MSLAMHANPGGYALLVGSGVSRTAGVRTGWDIILDLIRKVGKLRGADELADPEQWFVDEFHSRPTFGGILDLLQLTEEERRKVLRPYIEGHADMPGGVHSPTAAHRAMAALVKQGAVRLILTTNIDRLMETALIEAGVKFDVLTSDASFSGAPPIHETTCLLAKLHGDYREPGVRLMASELETYPTPIRRFLRGTVQDFGLVVCGWSADWDIALRNALLCVRSYRFTSFWLHLAQAEISEPGLKVVEACRAVVVPIDGADAAFTTLQEDLVALASTGRSHPETLDMVVEKLRETAGQERPFAGLDRLLHEETENLHAALAEENARWNKTHMSSTGVFHGRLHRYEELSERMIQVVSALAFYYDDPAPLLLSRCIERIAAFPEPQNSDGFSSLQRYPALLLAYAAGITSLAGERYDNLYAVLLRPEWWSEEARRQVNSIAELNSRQIFGLEGRKLLPCADSYYDWLRPSFYLSDNVLRPQLVRYEPSQQGYNATFDIFEFIQSMAHMDADAPNLPLLGRFVISSDYFVKGDLPAALTSPVGRFFSRIARRGKDSPLLRYGFFGGDENRLASAAHAQRVKIADFAQNQNLF